MHLDAVSVRRGLGGGLLAVMLACCSSSPPPTSAEPSTRSTAAPSGRAPRLTLTGEVLIDGASPSNYRDECVTLVTPDFDTEVVLPDAWTLDFRPLEGWQFLDVSGEPVIREHHAVRMLGEYIGRDGCRETGRVFRVSRVELPFEAAATLNVEIVGGGFKEGSVNVVRLIGADGGIAFQAPVASGESTQIPAGAFTLLDYQKPCNANCGMASGFELPCEVPFTALPGSTVTLTVLLNIEGDGCGVMLRDGPPADLVGTIFLSPYDVAEMPYEVSGRCVLVDSHRGTVIPVLPAEWTMTTEGGSGEVPGTVVVLDPVGRRIADEGDVLWLNGELGPEPPRPTGSSAFGCDYGRRFDISEVVDVRAVSP